VPSAAPSDAAATRLDEAVLDLCLMVGQPSAILADLATTEPGWALPPVTTAYLDLYAQTVEGNRSAGEHLDMVRAQPAIPTEREAAHLDAARRWQAGALAGALATLARWLGHQPRDLLALRIAQDLAFFVGDGAALLDVPARALGAWPTDQPGWGIVAGMAAFGLEEQGHYGDAEELARRALEVNPTDPWAAHALAHVYEMQGRSSEGARFLNDSADRWSPSFFASHNWWHLALFCIERDDLAGATELLLGPIDGTSPTVWFEVVNQVSLRWRLHLLGVDVALPDDLVGVLVERADEHLSAFNDLHAVAGLALAGETDAVERVIAGYGPGSSLPTVGWLLRGVADFAAGRFTAAAEALTEARAVTPSLGGSAAQRDLVDQTLLVATVRSGGSARRIADLVATHPTRWSDGTTERLLGSR
jgi:tetratricopeptide (TPR) repeat protein